MKNLITLFLVVFTINSQAQSNNEIKIELKNGKPEIINGDASNLKLPFVLSFKVSDFNDKEIIFMSTDKVTIPGSKKVFGVDVKTSDEDQGYYKINFDINENKVINSILGDTKLPNNSLIFKVMNTEFPISYKVNDENTDAKAKVKQEPEIKYIAGYIYYDAITLASNEIKPKLKLEILESYSYKGTNDNPYLKVIYDEENSKAGVHVSITPSSFLSSFGNADVTYFAAGLARFLAERTKEELNEAFFNKMKEQLNAYPELKTTFPKTANILEVIETFSYASVIQVLKEAFETDIQNLPENLYNIKDLTRSNCDANLGKKLSACQARLDKLEAFFKTMEGQWIGLGMFTVKEAAQSSNPYDLLASIAGSEELKGIKFDSKTFLNYDDYNLASSIDLANFISQSLKSKEENQIWITSKELNALFKDNDLKTFKIFLGLLLAKEQNSDVNIDFYYSDGALKTFGTILKDIHTKADVYEQTKTLFRNTYSAFNSANSAIKKIAAATEKSIEAEPQALYDYYRTFTASLKPIANSEILKTITGRTNIGSRYNSIEQFLNPSVDLAYHIATKKYSAALYDAVLLLNNTKVSAFDKPVAKSFIKYGTLISTVANAQSSDEVKKAIEASVLPAGSYAIKQNSRASLSINSYVGAYYSFSKEKSIPVSGLIAPIGFNFSQGVKNDNFFNKYLLMGGYSVNLQLIDLGALVNYYLIKGDTAAIPNDFKIKLSNIFAPGVSVNYNIKKTPLSLAFGTQYIPTLYKYELINGVNELTSTNAWRWQISLLVDIPLYNLKVWDFKK